MNRVPAFTLLEMAVVLALTSVVFSLGYLAYGMVFKGYQGFQKQQELNLNGYALGALFNSDFQACELIEVEEEGLLLIDRGKRTRYQNEEEYLLRIQGQRIDTFYQSRWMINQDSVYLYFGDQYQPYSLKPKTETSWH